MGETSPTNLRNDVMTMTSCHNLSRLFWGFAHRPLFSSTPILKLALVFGPPTIQIKNRWDFSRMMWKSIHFEQHFMVIKFHEFRISMEIHPFPCRWKVVWILSYLKINVKTTPKRDIMNPWVCYLREPLRNHRKLWLWREDYGSPLVSLPLKTPIIWIVK